MPRPFALLLALVTLASAPAGAQSPSNRQTESLDGLWQVRAVETLRGAPPEGWRDIQVPSAFETALGLEFDGVAEYRRALELERPAEGEQYFVRFGAVMTEARVLFNDTEVGHHLGGWTPFRCELPREAFGDGTQELRVVVDEKVGHNTDGFLPVIQPHFGGIWQSVELVRHVGPAFDPDAVELLTELRGDEARVRVLFEAKPRGVVRFQLLDGERELVRASWPATGADGQREETVEVGSVRPWGPGAAHQYRAELDYHESDDAPSADRISRQLAFREIQVEDRLIRLNGAPLQVRGILHWGYEPPLLAPNPPASVWRDELRLVKSLGFNMIKACLWLPPPSFFEVAQEEGVLVWQEYPAWHPDFSEEHLEDLLREYSEFFHLDRGRASIVVRSLTCETGHAAASDAVVKGLYESCKAITGAELVEDDSSWITWNRYHDFYDDHPYGNHAPWVGRLEGFDRYIEEHGAKPLLLGEAMAAGTWIDFAALEQFLGDDLLGADLPWWRPNAIPSRLAFEDWIAQQHGEGAVDRLLRESHEYALTGRKYQFESFRRALPEAGYVSTVLRDIRHCQMGYLDHANVPKWSPEDFAWHGEHMLVLDDPRAIRSLALDAVAGFSPALRVAGDVASIRGGHGLSLHRSLDRFDGGTFTSLGAASSGGPALITPEPDGPLLSAPFRPAAESAQHEGESVVRCRVRVELESGPSNAWTFWGVPEPLNSQVPDGVRVAKDVTPELLAWIEQGGRLFLLPGGQGAPRSRSLWFLRGAPFAPPAHPLLERVPRELLLELQPFDLDGPVFALTELTRAFDVVLGFWDTHDLLGDAMEEYAFLMEARVGEGRILACSLGLDTNDEQGFDGAGQGPNPARAWLRSVLLDHLAHGPAPRSRLSAEALATWHSALSAQKEELGGTWLLEPDPDDIGLEESWQRPDHDDSGWMQARAGVHWEGLGLPHYDGVAWYRKRFEVPEFRGSGEPLYLIFDGVDDSYRLYVNGEHVASFGDPETGESVWLVRTHADIAPYLQPGENLVALRVVDHVGAGGLHRRVWLSTQPPEAEDLITR